jgi:GT2 family glycosyltransferase
MTPSRDSEKVLAVVPVYGHHDMTHELVDDLARESDLVDIVIVDNRGDYPACGSERVVRPGANLGWAGGTNFGTQEAAEPQHSAFVWLNNDTRLCPGFIAGLVRGWRATDAALLAPMYDCYWLHQRPRRTPAVTDYRPRNVQYSARFVDGTCMLVPRSTVASVGLLDAETFDPIGWGAEIDYGLRVHAEGLPVVVTGLAYLHHEKSTTGKTVYEGGLQEYAQRGFPVLMTGMCTKWGDDWQRVAGIDPASGQTQPPGLRTRITALRRGRR